MTTRELTISGMSCEHCVMALKKQLLRLHDVEIESIGIGKAIIAIDEEKTGRDVIAHAVEEAGYQLVEFR